MDDGHTLSRTAFLEYVPAVSSWLSVLSFEKSNGGRDGPIDSCLQTATRVHGLFTVGNHQGCTFKGRAASERRVALKPCVSLMGDRYQGTRLQRGLVQAASDRHDSCHVPQSRGATFAPTSLYLSQGGWGRIPSRPSEPLSV